MPYSAPHGKLIIKDWLRTHPDCVKTAIDFGAGAGYYGRMIKEIQPKIKTIAMEIWRPYIDRFRLKELYDEVIFDDIQNFDWPDADLAIFGDVLEHFNKSDALKIIELANLKYGHIIIDIPVGKYKQGEWGGNPHEAHKSTWFFPELHILFTLWPIKAEINKQGIFIK